MTEQAYRDASRIAKSRVFQRKNFSEIAIYFDEATQSRIPCMFENSENCTVEKQFDETDFLINKDVFQQIANFTSLSYIAKQTIIALVSSFAIVLVFALGLAMNSEVKNQEKSLAILRAFDRKSNFSVFPTPFLNTTNLLTIYICCNFYTRKISIRYL